MWYLDGTNGTRQWKVNPFELAPLLGLIGLGALHARLFLTLRLAASPVARLLSAAAQLLPPPVWRAERALRPRALWRVEAAAAVIDGRDLGDVVSLTEQVALGDFVIPRAALFATASVEFGPGTPFHV